MNEELREQLALLPEYLGSHMFLTLLALGTGILISIPLGVLAVRIAALRVPVLMAANVIQTIPGLALLAVMVVVLERIGFLPAFIGLVAYSILPILRNTVTGLSEVEPRLIEAARGIGMTPTQVLLKVRLPLAMPMVIAGIRTATVWTVGLATLSTPVGATSLGNYIFSGLQTQNFTAVLMGSVSAALLAIVLDAIIGLLQYAVGQRRHLLTASALLALLAIGVVGLAMPALQRSALDRDGGGEVRVVGGKGFTEQYILAELIAGVLADAGFQPELRSNLGSTVAFQATASGAVDCYVEYTGTCWANQMNRTENAGQAEVQRQVVAWLEEEHGIRTVGPLGFENRYALAMRAEQAAAMGIETVSELAAHAPRLSIGSDYEFSGRPEWYALRDTYNLQFAEKRSLDPTLMYPAIREEQVDVITAYTTDGRIAAYDLQLLEDDRGALLPYDALLIAASDVASDEAFLEALAPLVGAISNEAMRRANKMVDVDKRPVSEAAAWLRKGLDGVLPEAVPPADEPEDRPVP